MKPWKKIVIGISSLLLVVAIVGFTVHQSSKNVVTVQTGKAQHLDLATVVSASGEIKPKTYVNIGANAYGKITHLYVKEGDHVKKGQLLAQLENVQSSADVNANQASVQAAATDAIAADVTSTPVSPKDVLATAFHLLGIDPHTTIRDRVNRPLPIAGDGVLRRELLGA